MERNRTKKESKSNTCIWREILERNLGKKLDQKRETKTESKSNTCCQAADEFIHGVRDIVQNPRYMDEDTFSKRPLSALRPSGRSYTLRDNS